TGSNTSNPNRIASFEDTAKLFPGAQASDLSAYAAANPGITNGWSGAVGGAPASTGTTNTASSDSSSLGGLASGLTGLSNALNLGTPPSNPLAPIQQPNYAGTGTNSAMFNQGSGVSAASLGGGANSRIPLGPAANNTLLAQIYSRL